MKISHLTSVSTTLNPFSAHSKIPRLILALLGPNAHKSIKIKTTQLPRASRSPAVVELGFKDGKQMKWQWAARDGDGALKFVRGEGEASLEDVVSEVNRHTRMLGRKEDLTS